MELFGYIIAPWVIWTLLGILLFVLIAAMIIIGICITVLTGVARSFLKALGY